MINRIIGIVTGNTPTGEKQNVIRYLEMLSCNADAANILTNGPIMLVLVKMLRQSKASLLRAQLASLIGALTDGLRDRQDKVRRFSMAALGELLFYISTQNENARDYNALESPSKDNRPSSGWQVSVLILDINVLD
nr:serine/threonine-protein kinase RUNKEL [Ipomoea batatas]